MVLFEVNHEKSTIDLDLISGRFRGGSGRGARPSPFDRKDVFFMSCLDEASGSSLIRTTKFFFNSKL